MKNYKVNNLNFLSNTLESESIDLVVIDPPYKLTAGGDKDTILGGINSRKNNPLMLTGEVFKHNKIKSSDWFRELYRVLKNGTHCYVMCNDKYVKKYLNEAEKVGFKEVNILIWDKGMHTPTQYYMKNAEFILMFRKGSARYINNLGSKTIISIKGLRGNRVHPSEKPSELMEHLITNSSKEGDVVLDCFMGSGSTGVACINTNRSFIGYEIDDEYFNIAKQRIEDVDNKQIKNIT